MSPRALKLALAASITLNVFVLGTAVGAIATRMRMDPQRPPPAGNPLMQAGERLADPHRNAFRARLRAEGQANRQAVEEGRRARHEAVAAFGRDPYDRQAAADALVRARNAEFAVRARLDGAVIDFAADLPPDQRRILAAGLLKPPMGRSGMERGGRHKGPPR